MPSETTSGRSETRRARRRSTNGGKPFEHATTMKLVAGVAQVLTAQFGRSRDMLTLAIEHASWWPVGYHCGIRVRPEDELILATHCHETTWTAVVACRDMLATLDIERAIASTTAGCAAPASPPERVAERNCPRWAYRRRHRPAARTYSDAYGRSRGRLSQFRKNSEGFATSSSCTREACPSSGAASAPTLGTPVRLTATPAACPRAVIEHEIALAGRGRSRSRHGWCRVRLPALILGNSSRRSDRRPRHLARSQRMFHGLRAQRLVRRNARRA